MKNFIICLSIITSFSAIAENKDFIARQDLNLTLDHPEHRLSSFFKRVKCSVRRLGAEDILIQRGDKLTVVETKLGRSYFGSRKLITSTWGGITVPQRVYDKFAGVFTFTLENENKSRVKMVCTGVKSKIRYESSDSNVNYSGIPIVKALNDVQALTYEDLQDSIEDYFELH